jgi:hypothetical protein
VLRGQDENDANLHRTLRSAANLTSLAGAAQAVANTTEGAAFLASLPGSNKTLFAPTNEVSATHSLFRIMTI